MESRATECEIMELENNDPTEEPVSLPLGFLRSITDDFCDERELGKGAYGVVYKGILPCGSVIAIKKFHETVLASEFFEDEASFLMDIEHQNVVQLLGFCAESRAPMMMKQPNGKRKIAENLTRMLCFEYMCKGGLDKHLSDESSGLEWNTRYKIIKGISSGLKYLHERNIIHRDLKPQNILMDITMVPKIADFGLSRLLGEQSYIITSNRAGTLGYMAPEYIQNGEISKKTDIFSLGVIIIEILKGCKDGYPDYRQNTKADFQNFIEKVLSNWRRRFERSSKYTAPELCIQLVKQCIDIALECVHPEKEKRPDVSNIIEILNAAEESCYDQNSEDLQVDHQMGTQEGLPTSGLVALNKVALKDHAQAWTKIGIAPHGSLAAICYQGARNESFWVAHKALASLEDNVLKDWAATVNLDLGSRVEDLERELKSVKVILELTLGKVIHNSALEENILPKLRELVYDAEDVLDEMEYFRIQHAEGCAHNLDLNVFPSVHDEPMLRFDRYNTSGRIEHIVKDMQRVRQEVSSNITLLGSDWSTAPNIAESRPITISESIETKLYGREPMMKSILYDITEGKHSSQVLTVIPIVGPGGIGKTTLAQHIYHSEKVQQHFDVKVWTCVSLNFNVKKLLTEIKQYIPEVDGEISNGTASELIGQRLKNKRLLLVLDDIWDCNNEDEWKLLLLPFQKSQVQGNIIIVTTRFPAQAQIMDQKNDQSKRLEGLEQKEFEELFQKIIFGDDDKSRMDTSLLETGSRIASELKGSPLAAKTVGRLLKTQLDLVHWTRILESKEWKHSDGKYDIMPALKLSFDYLPSQLQQCFLYCALFPQDYKFERQELINFWIGQEVLHSTHGENKRVEDIGLRHLTELVKYGFLENKGGKDGKSCYIIHDLLHELARKVSSLEFLSIDSSQSQVSSLKILPSIRHLSIKIDDTSVNGRLSLKNCVEDFNTLDTRLKVEKLRTLMIFGELHGSFVKAFGDLFRKAKALRLVFLSSASYPVENLLHNFHYLIHLRYLHIITYEVPFAISRFYHMKVLDARHCQINWLQADISNLVKLRHFLVKDDRIHSSIVSVGKLKSLQELRRFVVKQDDQGFELRQIGHLEELCGSLRIRSLENVQVPKEADEAKLMLKSYLHELILHWNVNRSTKDSALEEQVLERLKPSSNLQELSIIGHRGGTCPSWLGMNLSLSSLQSLCLADVNWKTFPPIGDLWLVNVPREEISINIPEKRFGNLRRLELVHLSGLQMWAVHAPCQLFPYLEKLVIRECFQLVEFSFLHSAGCCQQGKDANDNLFPRLSKIEIERCPQLSSFAPVPWTEAMCSITIRETSTVEFLSSYGDYLQIKGNKNTTDSTLWNVLAFHNLAGLKRLDLYSCKSLPLRYIQMLSSLRKLQIEMSYSKTFSFIEADSHVKYQFPVESLEIREWSASAKELTQLLVYFPKLSDLLLSKCWVRLAVDVRGQHATKTPGPSSPANKVEQQQVARAEDDIIVAPERGLLLLPPQLQELQIYSCSQLSLLCYNSNEEDRRTRGGGGLQGLTSLRRLKIEYCRELLSTYSSSSLSSSSFPFPNSLERLEICGAVGTRAPVPLSNLTSLTGLTIYDCKDLRGEGWLPLLAQGHLTKLSVYATPNFFVVSEHLRLHEQDLPPCSSKLQELKIEDVAGFTAATIRRSLIFSSLSKLEISKDNKVERFTEEQEALLFVNSLEGITLSYCDNLQFLPKRLHRLPNLKRLHITKCRAIQMLPMDGLLGSLEELYISSCPKIRSVPKDFLPDSLQKLDIRSCPAIWSLPKVDDLPMSLRELDVSEVLTHDDNMDDELWEARNDEITEHLHPRFANSIPIVITTDSFSESIMNCDDDFNCEDDIHFLWPRTGYN